MNYTEAVRLAKAGKEEGFTFLYESTYKSKYYLALKYMKQEEAAKDVLQDAYIRAFSKLETLKEAEAFPGWLGMIVANTAKNELVKKNPILFTDAAVDEEGESFPYQIEDEDLETQPECAYTRQETKELVHELLDSLPEEQRMCLLMFHIEGIPIREIAQALDCPENTVKSRLNYGRKNLKAKAEELKKKGYKLYSLAPLPLLLYLLRAEEGLFGSEDSTAAAGAAVKTRILSGVSSPGAGEAATAQVAEAGKAASAAREAGAGKTAGVRQAVRAGASAGKKGVLHTVAGKCAAVAVAVCAFGGAAFGLYQMNSADTKPQYVEKEVLQDQEEDGSLQGAENDVSPDQGGDRQDLTPAVREVQPEDYSVLLAGNLTMEELEFVLAYGTEELSKDRVIGQDETEVARILAILCEGEGSPIKRFGPDEMGRFTYSLADVNRLFSFFTTYQFTEENDSDTDFGLNVEGDGLKYVPPTVGSTAAADITAAEYTEEEMRISFTYERNNYGQGPSVHVEKLAVLHPDETGKYRLVSIKEV